MLMNLSWEKTLHGVPDIELWWVLFRESCSVTVKVRGITVNAALLCSM